MQAMQYEITLPADYDMEIIRKRVATRGHLLDDFPGLGLKAYLMRERGAGSPVNSYAPFYLWATPEGMHSFLWGPGFQGIVDDFGRPRVRHWAGLAYAEGPASAAAPVAATRLCVPVPEGVEPAGFVAREADRALAPGAVASAVAIDPDRWELVRFTLWERPDPPEPGDRFEVLHLSQPGRARLAPGRQW
ncbi:DUF4865 family protein [Streptomyces sp. NBC_00083]|uniref:DUF4865 family protein n=1 Tax=Streptomyces sp. NBC_00083 TaxID=2975647 RepID=UPI00224F9FC1|nr:DUF4865 family protein [Streptomyces sp. NBC_00083]MCX5383897.1 DUF4865 family protein [Streptomyces sp. NBC_00083]